jgi:hypothetical protein
MNLPEAEGKGRQARPAPGSQVRRQDKPSPYREPPNSGRSTLITIATQHCTMLTPETFSKIDLSMTRRVSKGIAYEYMSSFRK